MLDPIDLTLNKDIYKSTQFVVGKEMFLFGFFLKIIVNLSFDLTRLYQIDSSDITTRFYILIFSYFTICFASVLCDKCI